MKVGDKVKIIAGGNKGFIGIVEKDQPNKLRCVLIRLTESDSLHVIRVYDLEVINGNR